MTRRRRRRSAVAVIGTLLLAVGLYLAGAVGDETGPPRGGTSMPSPGPQAGSATPSVEAPGESGAPGTEPPGESGAPGTEPPGESGAPGTEPPGAPDEPGTADTPTDPPAPLPPDPSGSSVPSTASVSTTAETLLATLPVKGRAPKTGYGREEQFGSAWLDVDQNGCNTRDDILARDLVDIVRSGPCRVQTGTLADPYTGTTIGFVRGQDTSALVQIDHLVALLDAWQTGAQQSTAEERVAFANDPLNLEAADGSANSSKGAADAATWLPPNTAFRCEYVARQIAVKAAYELWVTVAEHDAMARVLSGCPGQPIPTSG